VCKVAARGQCRSAHDKPNKLDQIDLLTVRLHVIQRTAFRRIFRPSVCLSVRFLKRMDCDKTKETCAHILTPHERTFVMFSCTKNGCWVRLLVPEILVQTYPIRAKTTIFNRYSLVAPQP